MEFMGLMGRMGLLDALINEEDDDGDEYCDACVADDVAVMRYGPNQRVLIHLRVAGIADGYEDSVPKSCTQTCVEDETQQVHTCKSCGDADELSDGRNHTSDERRDGSVAVEVFLSLFHLPRIDEAHVTEAAVGKGIDNGAAQKVRQAVVDHSPDEGTQRAAKDDHGKRHLTCFRSHIGSRYHHHLARKRDERTLDGHEQDNPAIVQVLQRPLRQVYNQFFHTKKAHTRVNRVQRYE